MDPILQDKHFRLSNIMIGFIKNLISQFIGLVPELQGMDQAFYRICEIFGRAFPFFNDTSFSIHELVERMVKVFFQDKYVHMCILSIPPFEFESGIVSSRTRLSTRRVCDVVLIGPAYNSEFANETAAMFLMQKMCQLIEGAERSTEYQIIANTVNFMSHIFSAFCTLVSEVQANRIHTEPLNIRVPMINESAIRELDHLTTARFGGPPARPTVPVEPWPEVLRTWSELRADAGAPAAPAAPPPSMLPEQPPTVNFDQLFAPGPSYQPPAVVNYPNYSNQLPSNFQTAPPAGSAGASNPVRSQMEDEEYQKLVSRMMDAVQEIRASLRDDQQQPLEDPSFLIPPLYVVRFSPQILDILYEEFVRLRGELPEDGGRELANRTTLTSREVLDWFEGQRSRFGLPKSSKQ